mgnify:FL=1
MEESKVLQMVFKNSIGKKVTMSIEDPKDALTEAEIKAAMDVIVEKNIFKKNNYDLVEAVEAKIVTTGTTTYDLIV